MAEQKQTVKMTPDEYVEYQRCVRLMNDAISEAEVDYWFYKAMKIVDQAVARNEAKKASEQQSAALATA